MKNKIVIVLITVLTVYTISVCAQEPVIRHYLSITQEVNDYAVWKKGFDIRLPERTAAGIKDIFIKRDINNTNRITTFFEIRDLDKAKAFVSDPGLKKAMANAGAISSPKLNFYKSVGEVKAIKSGELLTMITHPVKDFSSWQVVHESTEYLRDKAGMEDILLLRSLADDSVVTILGTSMSLSKFNNYMSSIPSYWNTTETIADTQKSLEKTVVIPKPNIRVLF